MLTLAVAAVVLLPLAQTPPAATRAETASIRGRVTDKVSGEPIARAVITAAPADGRSRATATLADDDGRYVFPAIVPGRYFIRAEAPRFAARYVGALYRGTTASNTTIALQGGEERTSIDIALPRAYAITGRVVDVDGEPAARVRVVARQADGSGGRGPGRETDDLGRFRIFGLPPGRYTVCSEFMSTVSIQVRSRLEQPVTTCYPSATSGEGRPVEVKSADVDGIEIRLVRTRTFTVSGTILDSTGNPAGNAQVSLEKHIAGGSSSTGISGGSDGRFVMRNITPGDYTVNARIGGPYRPAERRELEVASVPITVGSADVAVLLTTARTIAVPGRIVFAGTTTPPPRDPGYGPMIVIANPLDGVERSGVRTSTTVENGLTFELTEMFGPRVLDVVNVPSGWVLESITYRGRDVTDKVVNFEAGGEAGTIEVVMHNRGAVVIGRVLDDAGKPVQARVLMIPVDPMRRLALSRPVTALSSVAAGTYAFRRQRAGEYAIVAIDPADPIPSEQNRAFFERILRSGQTITLAENERRAVDLRVSRLVDDR